MGGRNSYSVNKGTRLCVLWHVPCPTVYDWLTVRVQTALYRDLRFMGRRLTVDTAQGVVTLRGKVDSDADKLAATAIALSIDGVKDVRSDRTVVPPEQRAQVEATDEKISRLLKDQLRQDPQLQGERIDARVDVGVVTLTGEVNSSAAGVRRERRAEASQSASAALPARRPRPTCRC